MRIEIHTQHRLQRPAQPGIILKRTGVSSEGEEARGESVLRGRVVGISGRGVVNEPVDDYLGEGALGVAGEGVARLGAEEVGVDGEGEAGDVGGEEVGEGEGVEGAGGWGFVVDAEELVWVLVMGVDWCWKGGDLQEP